MTNATAEDLDLDDYPCSDGQPMAETPYHAQTMMLLHQSLEDFFGERQDVFIATDTFWYWEKGNAEQERRRADQLGDELARLKAVLEAIENKE